MRSNPKRYDHLFDFWAKLKYKNIHCMGLLFLQAMKRLSKFSAFSFAILTFSSSSLCFSLAAWVLE